jgi:predicted  nucleic acid-binding Zn-ribbon protein
MRDRLDRVEAHDERIEQKVDSALLTIADNVAKLQAHNIEAESWKSEIRENRRTISDLRTRAGARPDPYTGTDARKRADTVDAELRALDRRLDALERALDRDEQRNGVKR